MINQSRHRNLYEDDLHVIILHVIFIYCAWLGQLPVYIHSFLLSIRLILVGRIKRPIQGRKNIYSRKKNIFIVT